MRAFAHFQLGYATVKIIQREEGTRVEIDGSTPSEHIVVDIGVAEVSMPRMTLKSHKKT